MTARDMERELEEKFRLFALRLQPYHSTDFIDGIRVLCSMYRNLGQAETVEKFEGIMQRLDRDLLQVSEGLLNPEGRRPEGV